MVKKHMKMLVKIYIWKGIAGLIWSILWAIFTANNPAEHKFISEQEREFIKKGANVAQYVWTILFRFVNLI